MLPAPASETIRQEALALYRVCKFTAAADKYKQASELEPQDPAPLRGESGALFEAGKYKECLEVAGRALALQDGDLSKRNVLQLRRAKCAFFLKDFERAQRIAEGIISEAPSAGDEKPKKEAQSIKEAARRAGSESAADKPSVVDALNSPYYHPSLYKDMSEFFPRGHDVASAAVGCYDDELKKLEEKEGRIDISVFYGGCGDARHALQQLHHLYAHSKGWNPNKSGKRARKRDQTKPTPKAHLLLQDHKPHIMARAILIFRMLHECNSVPNKKGGPTTPSEEKDIWILTLWYMWTAEIMPPWAYKRMTDLMRKLQDGDDTFGVPYIFVDPDSASNIRAVYKFWIERGQHKKFDVKYAQTQLQGHFSSLLWENNDSFKPFLNDIMPEWDIFTKTKMLLPPHGLTKKVEPMLLNVLDKMASHDGDAKWLQAYSQRYWKQNITLLQEDEWFTHWFMEEWSDTTDIMDVVSKIISDGTGLVVDGVCDLMKKYRQGICIQFYSMAWLHSCADALRDLDIIIECRVGDVNRMLDAIQYSAYSESERPVTAPRQFDSVYMSNVTDYTGGHLTAMIHAFPVLKQSGYAIYCILVNPICFNGQDDAFAEYMGLSSQKEGEILAGIKSLSEKPTMDNDAEVPLALQKITGLGRNLKQHGYASLTLPARWGPTSLHQLTNKHVAHRWIVQMFLKLALPVPRQTMTAHNRINQPLTLVSWARFLAYLVEQLSYPQHWITMIVDSILTGTVLTTARSASKAPMPSSEASSANPQTLASFDSTPFVDELRSLLCVQSAILPFKVFAQLPMPSDLGRYEITFQVSDCSTGPTLNLLGLVLTHQDVRRQDFRDSKLYRVLSGQASQALQVKYKNKLVSISSFEWDGDWTTGMAKGDYGGAKPVKARVKLEKTKMEEMKANGWKAWLIRTDTWDTMVEKETMTADAVEL